MIHLAPHKTPSSRGRRARAGARLLRREEGIALPLALTVMSLLMLSIGVALAQSLMTAKTPEQDRRSIADVQAADAGLEVARSRINKVVSGDASLACPIVDAAGGGTSFAAYEMSSDGTLWCSGVSEALADGATYNYRTSAPVAGKRTIVSTGFVDGVRRRVSATVEESAGTSRMFEDEPVFGASSLDIASNIVIDGPAGKGGVASNGDIRVASGVSICGDATPGPGKTVTLVGGSSLCAGYSTAPAAASRTLAPVDASAALSTNDNSRLCTMLDPCSGGTTWDPSTKSLVGGGTVTLTGNVYFLCELSSSLNIAPAAGSTVKIYIGGPGDCASQKADINTITAPLGQSPLLAVLSVSSAIRLITGGTTTIPVGLYSPASSVEISARPGDFRGAIAANVVQLAGRTAADPARYTYDAGVEALVSSATANRGAYRECRSYGGGRTAPPNTAC